MGNFVRLSVFVSLASLLAGCVPVDGEGPNNSQQASCSNAEVLPGTISSDMTLSQGSCYRVEGTTTITEALLTIEPGVTLVFAEGAGLTASSGTSRNGRLNAVGTEDEPILFTGEEKMPGYWKALQFSGTNSEDNVLEHVVVEYAGGSKFSFQSDLSNIYLEDQWGGTTRVALRNVTIRHSGGYGFVAESDSDIAEFQNVTVTENAEGPLKLQNPNLVDVLDDSSTFTGNGEDYIFLTGGTVSSDASWSSLDVPYRAPGMSIIGALLTLEAGVKIVFEQGGGIVVGGVTPGNDTGKLTARGTDSDPVVFTGLEAIPGYWKSIDFAATNSNDNVLDNVIVEYGGGSGFTFQAEPANVFLDDQNGASRLSISNSTLQHSGGYGLYSEDGGTVATCDNMTFSDNAEEDYFPTSINCN